MPGLLQLLVCVDGTVILLCKFSWAPLINVYWAPTKNTTLCLALNLITSSSWWLSAAGSKDDLKHENKEKKLSLQIICSPSQCLCLPARASRRCLCFTFIKCPHAHCWYQSCCSLLFFFCCLDLDIINGLFSPKEEDWFFPSFASKEKLIIL